MIYQNDVIADKLQWLFKFMSAAENISIANSFAYEVNYNGRKWTTILLLYLG